jgi:hypothetical protein
MLFEIVTQDDEDREADDRCVESWRSTLYTGSVCENSPEFHQYAAFLNAWHRFPTRSGRRVQLGRERVDSLQNLSVAIFGVVVVRLY